MTLIDRYITKYCFLSTKELADNIGVSQSFVMARIAIISEQAKSDSFVCQVDRENEMIALLNLIHNRKAGWAVEIAIGRLKKLEAFNLSERNE